MRANTHRDTNTTLASSVSSSSSSGYSSRSLYGSSPSMAVEIEQGEVFANLSLRIKLARWSSVGCRLTKFLKM